MIPPREQWAIQIDVTNVCNRACSNCTRFVGHHQRPFFMSVDQFANAVDALKDFPAKSPLASHEPHKLIGVLGGEPLLHPQFADLTKIMMDVIPERKHRGLWTGLPWTKTKHAAVIEEAFGYINHNMHNTECRHSPILIAVSDRVKDEEERRRLIDNCWLQRLWSGTITPRGFFFCEVAASFDLLFDGPGGLPVEPGCWDRPLEDFQEQIDFACGRCGIPLNLKGRIDNENVDDISKTNLDALIEQKSPRILKGKYVLHEHVDSEATETTIETTTETPWRYLQ